MGELPEYDEVFEVLLPIIATRRSETAVADQLFNRGISKLKNGHIHDAIDLLGRALPNLTKEEKKDRLVRCLYALANCYAMIDLYWAAHANYLAALSALTREFQLQAEIDPVLPMLLERMYWLEISVGRIPQAIWYLEYYSSVIRQIKPPDEQNSKLIEDLRIKDGVLAMLLLKADANQIRHFPQLVGFFESVGLHACALSLLFSFGGPQYLRDYGYVEHDESDEVVWKFLKNLWNQPAQSDLPARIETFEDNEVTLVSVLL